MASQIAGQGGTPGALDVTSQTDLGGAEVIDDDRAHSRRRKIGVIEALCVLAMFSAGSASAKSL